MKRFASTKVLVVLVVTLTLVGIIPVLLSLVQDYRKLGEVVRAWEASGPHTTLIGQLRERLASLWWLGPLRLAPPRDPFEECGVAVVHGWQEMLPLMIGLKSYLSCLEREIEQAQQDYETFANRFVVVVLLTLFSVLLVGGTWARLKMARHQETKEVVLEKGTECGIEKLQSQKW